MTAPNGPPLPCGHAFAALKLSRVGITECSACRAAVAKADRLNGWKEIAAALGVDRATAIAWYEREFDPLPVRHDRKGVYASRAALERWLYAGDMPLAVHTELKRLRACVPDIQRLEAELEQLKAQFAAGAAHGAAPLAPSASSRPTPGA